jgi:hypothetical protein
VIFAATMTLQELTPQLLALGADDKAQVVRLLSNALEATSIDGPLTATKFQALATQWKAETKHLSLIDEIVLHPAYQQIIGMGIAVVPHILQALEASPDHWFWALRSITGANPVAPDDRGRVQRMAAAWLAWGKENGYSV